MLRQHWKRCELLPHAQLEDTVTVIQGMIESVELPEKVGALVGVCIGPGMPAPFRHALAPQPALHASNSASRACVHRLQQFQHLQRLQ